MEQFILQNYFALIAAPLLTTVLCLLLRPLALKISHADKPSDRKTHDFTTPLNGGICIFFASILTMLLFWDFLEIDIIALFICSGLMLVLGVIDDQFDLPANIKLFAQIAISALFIFSSNNVVSNIGTPFGFINALELGHLSIPFTLLVVVGLTNAINMIDGCDGLATSIVIISLLALLYFGFPILSTSYIFVLVTILSSLVVFLFFNFSNSKNLKTFLGDGGSLFLGFLVAVSLIKLAEANTAYDPSIVLWFVAIPVFDLCTVIISRILLKRKITSADRNHIHHYIISKGFSHIKTTLLITILGVTLMFIGIFLTSNYPSLGLLSFLVMLIFYVLLRMLPKKI